MLPPRASHVAAWQRQHAGSILLVAVLFTALSGALAAQLGLDTSMVALLPQDRPSVQDLEAAEARGGAPATLTLAIESPSGDRAGMTALREELLRRFATLPEALTAQIDADAGALRGFVREHKHLYLDVDTLEELRGALDDRLARERARRNPFYIDLEDDDDALERLVADLEAREATAEGRFPDGLYLHPDGDLLALFLRLDGSVSKDHAVAQLERLLRDVDLSAFGSDLSVHLAGDVVIALEEQRAILTELSIAIALTLLGVGLVIFLFFRRVRALPLLAIGVAPGTLASFAVAELHVGQLNLTTAFLGSVLLGNGINPCIIWLARYFEERRRRGVQDAVAATHAAVLIPTLVASGAAAAAYASLVITDFRGFSDFGLVGGVGMMLCWVSAFLVLPAAAIVSERFSALRSPPARDRGWTAVLARLVERAPGAVVGASAACAVLAALAIAGVADDPMEYDFRQLRSERDAESSTARRINARVNEMLDSTSQGRGIAVLASRPADLPVLRAQLDAGDPEDFAGYRSLHDLLPSDVDAKLPLLADIRRSMLDADEHVDAETRRRIADNLPPERPEVPTIDDIPLAAIPLFVEKDGTRGLIVVVDEAESGSLWDGRYLVRWTEALRALRLADGSTPPLVGQAPVFADMIEAVYDDMPRAIGAALLVTLLLAVFGFRTLTARLGTVVALLLGVLWMAGAMVVAGMRLHFLNFIAFPITFGNGVDYPANVLGRFEREAAVRSAGVAMLTAIRSSGAAVTLCSLTTVIGYASLEASANLAIRSFGRAMVISEITCAAAALVAVPAMVLWMGRR